MNPSNIISPQIATDGEHPSDNMFGAHIEERLCAMERASCYESARSQFPEDGDTAIQNPFPISDKVQMIGHEIVPCLPGSVDKQAQRSMHYIHNNIDDFARVRAQARRDDRAGVESVGSDIMISGTGFSLMENDKDFKQFCRTALKRCLLGHTGVKDASIVGVTHMKYGEIVTAFVRKQANVDGRLLDSEELRSFIRKKLGHHLVPKYILSIEDPTQWL